MNLNERPTKSPKGGTMPLTEKQLEHIEEILGWFNSTMPPKYTKGATEHGGDIRDLTPIVLVENALEEALDNIVYLLTLREKLREK